MPKRDWDWDRPAIRPRDETFRTPCMYESILKLPRVNEAWISLTFVCVSIKTLRVSCVMWQESIGNCRFKSILSYCNYFRRFTCNLCANIRSLAISHASQRRRNCKTNNPPLLFIPRTIAVYVGLENYREKARTSKLNDNTTKDTSEKRVSAHFWCSLIHSQHVTTYRPKYQRPATLFTPAHMFWFLPGPDKKNKTKTIAIPVHY